MTTILPSVAVLEMTYRCNHACRFCSCPWFAGMLKPGPEDYGEVCLINDNIGILYDCKEDGVYISFYRNKKKLGIAFNKLNKELTYFPAIEMGLCGSKIQIFNDLDFPEDK